MIVEGIVTTRNADGTINIAPMGPDFSADVEIFELKPFQSSSTYQNLRRTPGGVFHITDDVLHFARAIANIAQANVPLKTATDIDGSWIANACRAHEFKVEWIDDTRDRSVIKCRVLRTHRIRDFVGFNRAKHAVIEAAILASRIDFLPKEEIDEQFSRLQTIVGKTGGEDELSAFGILHDFVHSHESVTEVKP